MNAHKEIQLLLFDYIRNELQAEESRRIEEHLEHCTDCGITLQELGSLLERTEFQGFPSGERDDRFWESFPLAVERKISNSQRSHVRQRLGEHLGSFVNGYRTQLAFAAGVTAIIAGVILWFARPPATDNAPTQVSRTASSEADMDRMNHYLRKSKILLVGLANMKSDVPIDLTDERLASRELISEARALKQRTLEPTSAVIINDLEPILIKLSNARTDKQSQELMTIREGISHANLLFKVRMAQAAHNPFVRTTIHEH